MSNITTYLVSASLILLVIRQIREHPLDARSLATPVLAVGAAAVMFLHSVPAGGSDLVLKAPRPPPRPPRPAPWPPARSPAPIRAARRKRETRR
jgi:hypothetical protein